MKTNNGTNLVTVCSLREFTKGIVESSAKKGPVTYAEFTFLTDFHLPFAVGFLCRLFYELLKN